MNKGGRPKKPIDLKEAEKLCALQCGEQEVADWFHVSISTLDRRIHTERGYGFDEFFTKHRVQGKMSLRRNLFRLSETDARVAIFLAKNWLGMVDRQDHDVTTAGKPLGYDIEVPHDIVAEAAAIIRDA